MKLAKMLLIVGSLSLAILMIIHNDKENTPIKKRPKKVQKDSLIPIDKITPGDSIISLLDAMIQVESTGNDSAVNYRTNAVGCLQIRPIMVEDVNRIITLHGGDPKYTLEDRFSRIKSLSMFFIWKTHYHSKSNLETIARCWNGGVDGEKKTATKKYWKKIRSLL